MPFIDPSGHPRGRPRGRVFAALVCLFATGCSTLRELPRAEFAAKPERKGVVVDTREGLHYKFDLAFFSPDTLVGQHLKDTEGSFEEYNTVAIPLEAVERMQVRQTNWLRTGVIAGAAAVAAIVGVASRQKSSAPVDSGPILPPPVP
jgi:hypothetical protein